MLFACKVSRGLKMAQTGAHMIEKSPVDLFKGRIHPKMKSLSIVAHPFYQSVCSLRLKPMTCAVLYQDIVH